MRNLFITMLLALTLTAAVNARSFEKKEQQAFIEASQALTRAVLCTNDMINADGDQLAFDEAEACVREHLSDDVVFDTPGGLIVGPDAVIAFFSFTAQHQTNRTTTLSNFLVIDVDATGAPGTGSIEIAVWTSEYTEVVSPGPFGPPGPRLTITKNVSRMEADAPGEWKLVEVVISTAVGPEPRPQFP